jgi:hypothetical protein
MAIGINDLLGMMYQDGDIYDVPFTEDQLLPVVNRPNNLEMLRRIQEFREPVTVEQLIASLPIVPAVVPPAPPVISQPDDFNMLRRMQEFRETTPVTLEQVIASLPVAPPVAPPPVISPPDDFGMLRRMQEFRETVPTVPVAPAEPRISEDVGLVPSRIVEPPFIQRDEVVTSPQLIDRPSLLGPPKEEPSGNTIDKLAKQILAQGTSGWTGEGFGSAEANAKDMARILAEAGITDIKQFGTKIVDVPESKIFVDDSFGGSEQVTPASQRKIYYNKATGQEIMPNYSRAGGNIWSGTFAGKGSTGYGVRFDAQGNPQFYTEYGGTTSDWVPFRENILKPAALAAAAIYGIPLVTEALTGAAAGAGAAGAGAGAATAAELAAAAELASAAGTLGTASAIPNILVTAGKLAPVMTAAEIAALAAPVTAGLLSTPSVTPSVPEPSNVVEVVAPKPAPTITPAEAVAAVTPVVPGLLPQPEPIPTVEVTARREVPREVPQIEEIPVIPPIITSPISIPEVTAQKQMTPKEIMSYVDTALKAAGLLGAGAAAAKEFDIVPVPTDWTSPVYQRQPWQPLPPIDFGTRELLRGTQFERFLNPQPMPTFQQPMGMDYNQLMSSLQGQRPVSIGDVISGIQGQYGQTNPGSVV